MSLRESAVGFVELTRPVNSAAAGVLTFVGAFVAGGVGESPAAAGVAVAATVAATGAGMAINDYFDRDVDRINNPERAIPRGAVSPRGALVFSAVLFAAAVLLAVQLPVVAVAVAGLNLVALVAYTELFKGLPGVGNAVVSYLVGSTFVFGAAAVDALGWSVGSLAVLAAVATFSREVVKDVEDVEGDRAGGLRTLPVLVGRERSLRLAAVLLGLAVLASPVPYVTGTFGVAYLLLVVPADAVMVYAAVRGFGDPGAGQRVLKYGMFVAAVAFVVGRAARLVGW